MYKAIIEIGGYKVGEEVPTDKAEAWLVAYGVPHVEKVNDESIEKVEEVNEVKVEEPTTSGSSILEDYLGRNSSVVKNNILKDELSDNQLKELLKLEKSDKNRYVVVKAIEKRLAD